jgi:Tfp pilus assembly PilM family ATPase
VLYLNVDGLTNLAIAKGTVCRFTRVVGGGLEGMAGEIAERRGIPVAQARALLYAIDLTVPAADEPLPVVPATLEPVAERVAEPDAVEPASPPSLEDHEAREHETGYSETIAASQAGEEPASESPSAAPASDADVRAVLENGIREISGEVRNSLDFHRSQDEGGQVSHVALSGVALELPGFAEALQASLGVEVRSQAVGLVDAGLEGKVSTSRLSVAAGLAAVEAPQ